MKKLKIIIIFLLNQKDYYIIDLMKINILTLFPEYFSSILNTSIISRAIKSNLVSFNIINIRDFTNDKHNTADERPFGGGPGMVMKVEPIDLALQSLGLDKYSKNGTDYINADSNISNNNQQNTSKIILTSAKGKKFDQNIANEYANLEELTIICGHYEGVDERVAQNLVDEEIRVGDYVLTGGEPATAVILDAVTRLIPEVLGNNKSNVDESHTNPGELGFPVYTRPEEYKTWKVPEVLLSGNHKKIEDWKSSKKVTDK
jgi:tRNA (guanine37-N1)-methyltransferase